MNHKLRIISVANIQPFCATIYQCVVFWLF